MHVEAGKENTDEKLKFKFSSAKPARLFKIKIPPDTTEKFLQNLHVYVKSKLPTAIKTPALLAGQCLLFDICRFIERPLRCNRCVIRIVSVLGRSGAKPLTPFEKLGKRVQDNQAENGGIMKG